MNIDPPHELALSVASPASLSSRWRASAEQLRTYGADAQATTLLRCAEELEQTWREWELEALTIEDAVAESGYTRSHLKRLLREQAIRNSGIDGETRILRRHLPKKPGQGVALPVVGPPNTRTQVADDFRVFRFVMSYPPIPAVAMLQSELPVRPKGDG